VRPGAVSAISDPRGPGILSLPLALPLSAAGMLSETLHEEDGGLLRPGSAATCHFRGDVMECIRKSGYTSAFSTRI